MTTTATTVEYPPSPKVDRKSLPPGPPEWPLVGQSFRYLTDPVGLIQEAAGYGDLVTMSVKPLLVYLVNHPDLVRELFVSNHQSVGRGRLTETLRYLLGNGLVTADGPFHLRQRRMMQPQFHRSRISEYAQVMVDFSLRHEGRWQNGARVDMAQEMSELTLHVVVKTLFGLELPDTVRHIGEAFEVSNDYVTVRDHQPPALRNLFHRWPLPLTRRFQRELAYLDGTVYDLIAQRRQSGLEGNDLLSLLLDAKDEQAESPEDATMTDQQLRDEVITLFAAGHETTAVALTWTWYLLATHPDAQARFHAELDDVLDGKPPAPEDLSSLTFTEQILTESMRLYPPIWSTGRMTFEPIELGGWQIPAGAALVAPQLVLHRDPRWSSVLTAGRRSSGSSCPGSPTTPSAAVPACVLARASRGWKPCCCWRRWASVGPCGTTHATASSWCPWFPFVPRAACRCSSKDAAETNREGSLTEVPHHSTDIQRGYQNPTRSSQQTCGTAPRGRTPAALTALTLGQPELPADHCFHSGVAV